MRNKFLVFILGIAVVFALGGMNSQEAVAFNKIWSMNFAFQNNSIIITLPNGTQKNIPLNVAKEIMQNISKSQLMNLPLQNIEISKEMEKIKEIYKHYGGNETKIEEEFEEEMLKNLKNISLQKNVSAEEMIEKLREKEKEVLDKVERKFINASAQRHWERHKVCIQIYPNVKECVPRVFPIFLNQTTKVMLPNGSIITINRTMFIHGLGKVSIKENEIEVENETSHSFIKEIKNRPVTITIVKTSEGVSVVVTNMISGVKNEINVTKEGDVFKHVVVHTKGNVSNVVVNITRIKNITLPPNAPKELSKALVFRINSNLSDADIRNVTFDVVVNQTWLNSVNSSINKIMVLRISENGTAQVLPTVNVTTQKVGNETFYHLTVVSPGFSIYAIFPLTVLPPVSGISETSLIVIAIIVVAIVALILLVLKRKKASKG